MIVGSHYLKFKTYFDICAKLARTQLHKSNKSFNVINMYLLLLKFYQKSPLLLPNWGHLVILSLVPQPLLLVFQPSQFRFGFLFESLLTKAKQGALMLQSHLLVFHVLTHHVHSELRKALLTSGKGCDGILRLLANTGTRKIERNCNILRRLYIINRGTCIDQVLRTKVLFYLEDLVRPRYESGSGVSSVILRLLLVVGLLLGSTTVSLRWQQRAERALLYLIFGH